MKKYFYVYDLENKEIVSCLYKTEQDAKNFLSNLVQVQDVDSYLQQENCPHTIKQTNTQIF